MPTMTWHQVETFSPPLDAAGNSVRGQLVTKYVAERLGLNLFDSERAETSPDRAWGRRPHATSRRSSAPEEVSVMAMGTAYRPLAGL